MAAMKSAYQFSRKETPQLPYESIGEMLPQVIKFEKSVKDKIKMNLKLKILGVPKAKQSARFAIRKGKGGANFLQKYQSKDVVQNERNIAFDVKSQLPKGFQPFSSALRVKAIFVFPALKSFTKSKINAISAGVVVYKTTKPDLTDNLMKGTMDALNGIVFTDDAVIAKVESVKIYGLVPRIELEFEELEG
ncbi:RusA family crossover junction endodeoxyribonuclease [uncultured Chryseobacterium sp.]|uniref:RusA family crossover junction endodeoxyribonuclease n=1 Tax=uncultured Chryseobacterium sp. TaxID=259322 RepID=UPI0025EAFDB2|nr:RusA family crossover junction endodeoxyribonuclease [uncultured Chryseobacterium sp.]